MKYEEIRKRFLEAHTKASDSMGGDVQACQDADRLQEVLKETALREGKSYFEFFRGEIKEVKS